MRRRPLAALLLSSAIFVLTPTAAHAAVEPAPSVDLVPWTSAEEAQLVQLAAIQSPEQAAAIAARGRATVLVDVETGEVLAARSTATGGVSTRAVSLISPGCPSTIYLPPACVYSDGGRVPLGFRGTGSLSFTMLDVKKFFAGDKRTYLNRGGAAIVGAAFTTTYLSSATDFTSITRE